MRWITLLIVLCNVLCLVRCLGPKDDPYKILGLRRSASLQDIRKSYKQLAKEWHPDKNDNPAAGSKFVEITQAYELLTDPERRKQFDNHGIINPDAAANRERREYNFDFDPFEDLFNIHQGGFKFRYQDPDITLFHKLSITTRAFENNLVPKSSRAPHLILFYSDWCFSCLKIEPIWRRVIEELDPIGIEFATAHSENERTLVKRCGISEIPALVLLIDGRTYIYRESMYSVQKIVEFVRKYFPYKLITPVNGENIDEFLTGWHDNRIRALLFQKQETIRLRYLVVAFYFRQRVSFGFVQLGDESNKELRDRYQVTSETDTLLLFNENTVRPVASLSMSVIPVQTMKHVITANKYLILPRLSSQSVLDSVCPVEWARPRKRLCVVLVSENTADHDEARQAMREFAQQSHYSTDRVRYSYIYKEKQLDFMNSIAIGSPDETLLNVVIIWRRDMNRIKYEWLKGGWVVKSQNNWNASKDHLESTIGRLLKTDEALTYEAVVKELIDEHAQGMFAKMFLKLLIAVDVLKENMAKEHILIILSVVGTIVFIIVVGYVMAYLLRLEEEKIKSCQLDDDCNNTNNNKINGVNYTPQLRLHELRAEKYNGMIRLLKPGCRTIVVLIDQQSKPKLLTAFHKIVWPYRKNKTLMFGYMFIERGIEWYKRLLTLSLPEPRELQINPRNCIGTVLSLNGHRKYFCMYHAKHPECTQGRGSKRMMKMTKTLGGDKSNGGIGGFMGFESSDSDSDVSIDVEQGNKTPEPLLRSSNLLLEENLLDGLPNWLDRLFEGTTHRYHINFWPDFPTK